MNFQDIVFVILAGVTLLGAFMAVYHPNVFYNALFLILAFFGVAGLYIFLHAEFLAVVQVIVYIGAISIAIIFAIMLSKPYFLKDGHNESWPKKARAILIAIVLFFGIQKAILTTRWASGGEVGDFSLKNVGRSLLTTHSLSFEIVSLILLLAIIGALVLSSKDNS